MISPLFVHLRSELILEGCLTEFLSAWWLENISMDLVFLYSRFSISTELFEINSWKTKSRKIENWRAGRVLSFPSDSKENVLKKAKLEKAGIVRFIQSFGLFEKIRIVNKVMRSQGEQTRKSWVYNNNYNMYQGLNSKTLKLNLKKKKFRLVNKMTKKENYERKK